MPALCDLPAFDDETHDLTVVIETPRGSRNKYKYDKGCLSFRLGGALPEGMSFPYDFGFIPSTLGQDGDSVDILVLHDSSVVVGCVLTARLLGVIEGKQRDSEEKGGKWVRNDRLVAVATHAHRHQEIDSLKELESRLLDEIEQFFVDYNRLRGKEFKPLGRHGPKRARKLVEDGIEARRKQQSHGKAAA